jgi:hypothetical protein
LKLEVKIWYGSACFPALVSTSPASVGVPLLYSRNFPGLLRLIRVSIVRRRGLLDNVASCHSRLLIDVISVSCALEVSPSHLSIMSSDYHKPWVSMTDVTHKMTVRFETFLHGTLGNLHETFLNLLKLEQAKKGKK